MSDREEFLGSVREALGRRQGEKPQPSPASALSSTSEEVTVRANAAAEQATSRASELMDRLEVSAAEGGWKVLRVATSEEATAAICDIAKGLDAKLVMHSLNPTLNGLSLEAALGELGIQAKTMAIDEDSDSVSASEQRQELRDQVVQADIGVTGVDYVIAETGTCVILPRKGVSRLTSLVPPVHVAVVEKGQVLETLDDLFALKRQEFLEKGDWGSYMSFITGPSRTADIEQTLTIGVHGPKEVHMVLIG